jgi:hypothetical protein
MVNYIQEALKEALREDKEKAKKIEQEERELERRNAEDQDWDINELE